MSRRAHCKWRIDKAARRKRSAFDHHRCMIGARFFIPPEKESKKYGCQQRYSTNSNTCDSPRAQPRDGSLRYVKERTVVPTLLNSYLLLTASPGLRRNSCQDRHETLARQDKRTSPRQQERNRETGLVLLQLAGSLSSGYDFRVPDCLRSTASSVVYTRSLGRHNFGQVGHPIALSRELLCYLQRRTWRRHYPARSFYHYGKQGIG